MDDAKIIEPHMDTGRWKAEMLALVKQAIEDGKETKHLVVLSCEDMHKLQAAWEAERKQKMTVQIAVKRGVMQILKGIGWLD